jgi:hypothetical protein
MLSGSGISICMKLDTRNVFLEFRGRFLAVDSQNFLARYARIIGGVPALLAGDGTDTDWITGAR